MIQVTRSANKNSQSVIKICSKLTNTFANAVNTRESRQPENKHTEAAIKEINPENYSRKGSRKQ